MQPNSLLNPLQAPQPSVPGVPQVPDVPKVPDVPLIPQTPEANQATKPEEKPKETPKITGVSLPAGSNKKPESPEQRNNKINAANAPKPQVQATKQNLLHKPVTMEEVQEYRKKRAKRNKVIFATILILLAVGGITTVVILAKNKQQSYQQLSNIYNDNVPIVITNAEGKIVLISQNGKTLTEKYDNIDEFESDRSLAFVAEEDKTITVIIDNSGKEKYSTENHLTKINQGQNYILNEDGHSYILNKDGQKLDERPLVKTSYNDEQEYFLVSDDNRYAVINTEGAEKITGVVDRNTLKNFSYGKSTYDGNYYCAIINTGRNGSNLYVYNCETAKEITNIEDVYYTGGFESSSSAFLTSEKGSSYFYNNEMLYNSDTQDQEFVGGIIKKANDERYFNPITKKTTESFPTDSLINQEKLSEKTTITEDCEDYKAHEASNLTQICDKIYYNNKLLSLNYDKFNYFLPNENLDDFLAYNKKHYIYRQNKTNNKIAIIDAETSKEAFSDVTIQVNSDTPAQATSRFIVKNNTENKTVIDLATGKTAEYESSASIRLETNYYAAIESTDSGYVAKYYNANHKEIYKEEN